MDGWKALKCCELAKRQATLSRRVVVEVASAACDGLGKDLVSVIGVNLRVLKLNFVEILDIRIKVCAWVKCINGLIHGNEWFQPICTVLGVGWQRHSRKHFARTNNILAIGYALDGSIVVTYQEAIMIKRCRLAGNPYVALGSFEKV